MQPSRRTKTNYLALKNTYISQTLLLWDWILDESDALFALIEQGRSALPCFVLSLID